MDTKTLTPMQVDLLRMFSFDASDDFVMEIKTVLNDYFQKKIDCEMSKLYENGVLSNKILEEWRHQDIHEFLRKYGKTSN